ncbi:MAG: hypothetical protein IKN82_04525 [Treponema sp.]|nr:hypothetical protein [Treponema sp.]MBR5097163.1 hypothetical protein [Treponema sp.]
MASDTIVCAQCGGTLAIDSSGEYGTCIYCGTKRQLVEKTVTVVEHTGKVEVDGIATAASKLTSAYQCLQTGNVEKANRLYKEITELEPQNPYAWWGRYLCEESFAKHYGFQDKYGNSDNITKANQVLEILKYADFAIQYAEDDVKEQYIAQTKDYRDYVEMIRNQPQTEPSKKSKKGLIIGIIIAVIIFVIFANL